MPARHAKSRGSSRSVGSVARASLGFVLYLSPVVLLSLIFPIVSPRIAARQIGGVSLTYVVLASSLTVPWLSQMVCLPIYRNIGDLIDGKNRVRISRRFCEYWVSTYLLTLPALALFVVPVALFMHWGASAVGAYALLTALHLLFVQSLVVGNVLSRKGVWAVAWSAYAASLLMAPTLWWLPPIVGTITQLVFLRHYLRRILAVRWIRPGATLADMARGLALGSVLWADKFLLFVFSGGRLDVVAIFMALMPAVIAYNAYFVVLAPQVDRAAAGLRHAITHEPYDIMNRHSSGLFGTVERSLRITMVVGALCSVPTAVIMEILVPRSIALTLTVIVASWLFMMVTLLAYQLDYIGNKVSAQVISAVHLLVCVLAFSVFPDTAGYWMLILADLVLFFVAYAFYRKAWRLPEFTLFWRQAVSW